MGRADVGLATREETASGDVGRWKRLEQQLRAPTDGAVLAYFRIGFGLIIAWETLRFADHGWITTYFIKTEFVFTWALFDWVKPWPGVAMYVHFAVLAFAGLLLAAGYLYRLSAAVVFVGISYVFLLDKARYLNHVYLVMLLAFLMIFLPANRVASADASIDPSRRDRTVPTWTVWLLRFQIGVPYVFGALAKVNYDWLVRLEPLRTWLAEATGFPILGPLFTYEPIVRSMAYGSLLLDLSVPFLMCWRRTRVPAFAAALAFHIMNSRLFGIGIFPWTMIVATAVFFPADWPRRMLDDLRRIRARGTWAVVIGFVVGFWLGGFVPTSFSAVKALIAAVGVAILSWHAVRDWLGPRAEPNGPTRPKERKGRSRARAIAGEGVRHRSPAWQRVGVAAVTVWVAVQVLVPLRHYVIPGKVSWTEEGHRFAWHMKLRSKRATSTFFVSDAGGGRPRRIDPDDYLTDRQLSTMSGRPDMIVDFAHFLERRLRPDDDVDLEVRAEVYASLNMRPRRLLIDPDVDLTKVGRPHLPPQPWITKFDPSPR